MSCATSTLKFLGYIFNVLLCVLGALSISANAYALATYSSSDVIRTPCIVGIVVSSLLFLSTFMGCCGALRDSVHLSWIYAVILLLLMAAQIALFFVLAVDFKNFADETISNAWNNELTSPGTMAEYEVQYACCGKTGPNDYIDSGMKVPATCYKNQNSTSLDDLYTEGCKIKITEIFVESGQYELISDWIIIGIEGANIIVYGMLAVSLKNKERRKRFH